jgi:hypothetical protein
LGFESLETMQLRDCSIRQLPFQFSQHAPNLRHLDLSRNVISNLQPLKKLKKLEVLIVLDNEINHITSAFNVLRRLKSLQILDLRHNPITAKFYPADIDSSSIEWAHRDHEFLQTLNDTSYVRRIHFRGVFLKVLPNLRLFDGLAINRKHRQVSQKQYERIRCFSFADSEQAGTKPKQAGFQQRNPVKFWVALDGSKLLFDQIPRFPDRHGIQQRKTK